MTSRLPTFISYPVLAIHVEGIVWVLSSPHELAVALTHIAVGRHHPRPMLRPVVAPDGPLQGQVVDHIVHGMSGADWILRDDSGRPVDPADIPDLPRVKKPRKRAQAIWSRPYRTSWVGLSERRSDCAAVSEGWPTGRPRRRTLAHIDTYDIVGDRRRPERSWKRHRTTQWIERTRSP